MRIFCHLSTGLDKFYGFCSSRTGFPQHGCGYAHFSLATGGELVDNWVGMAVCSPVYFSQALFFRTDVEYFIPAVCVHVIDKGGTAMPVLTSSNRLTPKSTLRHRPIISDTTREEPPRVRRASRTQTQQPAAPTTAPEIPAWKPATRLRPRRRPRVPLVGIGVGMVIAVMVVWLGQLLLGWVGTSLDTLHYGYPRTYQVDAVVGQGDSAAQSLHRSQSRGPDRDH